MHNGLVRPSRQCHSEQLCFSSGVVPSLALHTIIQGEKVRQQRARSRDVGWEMPIELVDRCFATTIRCVAKLACMLVHTCAHTVSQGRTINYSNLKDLSRKRFQDGRVRQLWRPGAMSAASVCRHPSSSAQYLSEIGSCLDAVAHGPLTLYRTSINGTRGYRTRPLKAHSRVFFQVALGKPDSR